MPIETLKKSIEFGMKNNLMVQYVMPPYDLSDEYRAVLESIDSIKIGIDVSIYDYIPQSVSTRKTVIRINVKELIENPYAILPLIKDTERLCICYKDICFFSDDMIPGYKKALDVISKSIIDECIKGEFHEVNLLTDILINKSMINCGAGVSNITIAPNGNFYLCPSFYYDELLGIDNEMNYRNECSNYSVGDVTNGVIIPNSHLLDLEHAPLCRSCDAFHCNRCIWLNRRLTGDANTPSHQQCIVSHIERNVSQKLSVELQKLGYSIRSIKDIPYIDPFDNYLFK